MENKCTVWDSPAQRELAGKIFWTVCSGIKQNKDINSVADYLKLDVWYCFELYKKYLKYHNEPVSCNEIIYKSREHYQKV